MCDITIKKMKKFYSASIVPNDGEYIYFCAKVSDLVITGFSGKKAKMKLSLSKINQPVPTKSAVLLGLFVPVQAF